MIRTSLYEFPSGDKWHCIVWDMDKKATYIVKVDEALEFYPCMKLRRAIKLIAIERFKDE